MNTTGEAIRRASDVLRSVASGGSEVNQQADSEFISGHDNSRQRRPSTSPMVTRRALTNEPDAGVTNVSPISRDKNDGPSTVNDGPSSSNSGSAGPRKNRSRNRRRQSDQKKAKDSDQEEPDDDDEWDPLVPDHRQQLNLIDSDYIGATTADTGHDIEDRQLTPEEEQQLQDILRKAQAVAFDSELERHRGSSGGGGIGRILMTLVMAVIFIRIMMNRFKDGSDGSSPSESK